MSYPRVQFVSAPSLDADVRFDCNSVGEWSDDDRWPEHDGFTLGFPTLAGDPEAIGVEYGTRQIEFNLIVRATPDAAFRVFSRLSREVQRPRNWLMVQFSDFSKPVWFYTYRTEQQALDFQNVSGIDDTKRNVWGIGVRLAADPLALGERVTLPAVKIDNAVTGTNPFHAALPAIAGDAPAPVRMRVETTTDWSGFTPLFSSIAIDGGPSDGSAIVTPLQNAARGTDAGTWVTFGYPGGGYIPVSFATNTGLVSRVTDDDTVLPVGSYRVLVWAANTNSASVFRIRGRHGIGGVDIKGDSIDFDRAGPFQHSTWVDLGVFTFPAYTSMDDQSLTYTQTSQFSVEIQRLSGTATMNLSMLIYIPVETPWSVSSSSYTAEFPATGLASTNRSGVWDEDGNYQMLVTSALPSRSVYDAQPPRPVGGLPVVVPGCVNSLTLLQQTNCHNPADPSQDNRDTAAPSATVTIDYAPRYLNLAGSEVL